MTIGSPPLQISVSVVTYNSADSLPAFLASLRRQRDVTWEAFFFDNASRDGTPALLEKAALGQSFVNSVNIGYGQAHNRNAAACQGRYLLLLNPDLEFGPDLFARLARTLDEHPDYGLVGPRILEGPDWRPFPPRHFYPGEGMVALEPSWRRQEISWLSGCCLMIRRDIFERLGGFDPDYFLYAEETDLCRRARRAGHVIGHAADTVVHHLHRQSQRGQSEYEYACRVFRGSAVFWEKHYAASDVVAMVRFQYWTAELLLRCAWMRGWLRFPRVLADARLRARRDVCRQWLETRGHRPSGGRGVFSIGLRQLRLIAEWARQRKFPLDDY
jgi:GT2 family glycosyltransferase